MTIKQQAINMMDSLPEDNIKLLIELMNAIKPQRSSSNINVATQDEIDDIASKRTAFLIAYESVAPSGRTAEEIDNELNIERSAL